MKWKLLREAERKIKERNLHQCLSVEGIVMDNETLKLLVGYSLYLYYFLPNIKVSEFPRRFIYSRRFKVNEEMFSVSYFRYNNFEIDVSADSIIVELKIFFKTSHIKSPSLKYVWLRF